MFPIFSVAVIHPTMTLSCWCWRNLSLTVTKVHFVHLIINSKSDIMHAVGPICLPKPEMEFDSYDAQTAGWGMTGAGGEQSDTLHYVKLRVSSRKYPHDTFLGTKVQKKKGKLQTVCEGDDGQTTTN